MDFIEEIVVKKCGKVQSVCDIFAGTASVSHSLIDKFDTKHYKIASRTVEDDPYLVQDIINKGIIIKYKWMIRRTVAVKLNKMEAHTSRVHVSKTFYVPLFVVFHLPLYFILFPIFTTFSSNFILPARS